MSYSYFDSSGSSVEIPTSAILPYISINTYDASNPSANIPPSGYVYCDGNYYPTEEGTIYYNLYQLIGTYYGSVTKTVGVVSTDYFRVPNLMGIDTSYFDTGSQINYPAYFVGGSFTTIGGINTSGNGNVNSTNTITLTTAQLPFHYHDVPGQTATLSITDTGHNHTLVEGTINIGNSTGGSHTHGIDNTPVHNHDVSNLTTTTTVSTFSNEGSYVPGSTNQYSEYALVQQAGYVASGQGFSSESPGLSAASGTANLTSTASITKDFANLIGNANISGTAAVPTGIANGTYITNTINTSVTNSAVSIPPTPSFIMNYLIKL